MRKEINNSILSERTLLMSTNEQLLTKQPSLSTKTKEKVDESVDVLLDELLSTTCRLIVHNDDVNTFDWVILSLVEICGHTAHQAEQCAMLIHFKGRYAVKDGSEDVLKPMKDALTERGIGATVEFS